MPKVGVRIAKGILYVIGCIAAVAVVVLLVKVAYETGVNSMNINMITKDAFARRVQAVLLPSGDYSDREALEKLFTPRALAEDDVLNSSYYSAFEISDYYANAEVPFKIVWPWQEEATVEVTEIVRDISGKLIEVDESRAESDDGTRPISWMNGVYEVTLQKDKLTESWRVSGMEMIEPIVIVEDEPEETATPVPEEAPEETELPDEDGGTGDEDGQDTG